MFSEYRDLVAQLKTTDANFARMFEQHDALDERIRRMETHAESGTHVEIENLKKEKLALKDQCYAALRKAGAK